MIIADLVATPERQKIVDFSEPMWRGIKEIVVTGPGGPEIATLDDLAGKEVYVRKASSYYEHLQALNKRFASERKPAVKITVADEDLEAEDILEMVNAGLVGATVVDRYKAIMWSRVFKGLKFTRAGGARRRRRPRVPDAQGQPAAQGGARRLREAVRPGHDVRQLGRQPLREGPEVREERGRRPTRSAGSARSSTSSASTATSTTSTTC